MKTANFEYTGNAGRLSFTTHFGENHHIICHKDDDEKFRLGGTGANDLMIYEGIIVKFPDGDDGLARFRAFRSSDPQDFFEGECYLSPEEWSDADRHCYLTEYYTLEMEGNPPGWIASKDVVDGPNCIFINLDILDGGGNVIRRYRVSPYTGDYCVMETV